MEPKKLSTKTTEYQGIHIFHKTYDRKQWVIAVIEKKKERKGYNLELGDFENANAL